MGNKNLQEKIKELPFFARNNVSADVYECFATLKEILKNRDENSPCLLNRKNVTGIWYLAGFTEGEPQVIIRVDENNPELKVGSYSRVLLHAELFDVIGNGVNYDYDENINRGEGMTIGTQEKLSWEIEQNRVLAVYDKERE